MRISPFSKNGMRFLLVQCGHAYVLPRPAARFPRGAKPNPRNFRKRLGARVQPNLCICSTPLSMDPIRRLSEITAGCLRVSVLRPETLHPDHNRRGTGVTHPDGAFAAITRP